MTPPTKRGVNFPGASAVGLGWLSITVRGRDEAERPSIVRELVDALGADLRPRERGIKGYEHAADVLSDSAIGWTAKRPSEVHLTLKQSDCTWERFRAVTAAADQYDEWRVSRVDLNFDDTDRRVELPELVEANRRGDLVTRVDYRNPGAKRVDCDSMGNPLSIYYGALASDRVLNVYDKDVERAAVLGKPVGLGEYGIRWELRLRDERAIAVVDELRRSSDDAALTQLFWQHVVDLVDFRVAAPTAGHHYEHRPRLSWWAELTDRKRRSTRTARLEESQSFRLWRLNRWLETCAAAIAEWHDAQEDPLAMRSLLDLGARKSAQKRARAVATFDLVAVPA